MLRDMQRLSAGKEEFRDLHQAPCWQGSTYDSIFGPQRCDMVRLDQLQEDERTRACINLMINSSGFDCHIQSAYSLDTRATRAHGSFSMELIF